jgi:hypothetical protein
MIGSSIEKQPSFDPNPNCPFHAIFFMDNSSGVTLLGQNYSQRQFDDDLISGMIKALESFIDHLSYSSSYELVQEINFQGTRILYERKGSVMAVAISKKIDPDLEHRLLNKILDEFYTKYERFLNNTFIGNVLPFQDFRGHIQNIGFGDLNNVRALERISQSQQYTETLQIDHNEFEFDRVSRRIQSPKFPSFQGFQQISK